MSSKSRAELRAENAALYESLQKAEERAVAGQFALEIMHEIRNPLEALGNLAYLTSQDAEDPAKVRMYMRAAEEQISRGSHIASETLSFAKATRSPQSSDLVRIVEAALRIHLRDLQRKRVHLVKRLPAELVVDVHIGEILQMVSNLIANAIEALPIEGSLHLRLKRHERTVQILVSDNGHGIAKENVKQIFRPFFTTREQSGTGLGLAIVKSVVDKHGGSVRVKSSVRGGGRGTTFRVTIPA